MNTAAPALANLPLGFADAVHGTQTSFRGLLDAMARPGRVHRLESATAHQLQFPPAISPAMAALLLTLCDADTRVWISPAFGAGAAHIHAFGRFHTGLVSVDDLRRAQFAFLPASDAPERALRELPHGSDEVPQDGATLVIDTPLLAAQEEDADGRTTGPLDREAADATPWVRLTGPGVQHAHRLAVGGLGLAFWRARQALQTRFPRGVDVVFTCGERVAAVPRSTQVEPLLAMEGN
ncbi:phosphonate C-P lyase system protein PhnH [Schlegelella sp. S2-27]|uniref:Phosphonate C-P lyase system protein PhnH n=1 Tax=Caldimonas mangrovi TaxID=2944811 RepID=A0ABT0YVV1_9BURK|nr:phosphonate C-P lyase system protein PhnH [Caldimonas mangrovi]MCM5682872.1 phosphonate C-P lyase system protein PhnH [Caldimonas mangrovi]